MRLFFFFCLLFFSSAAHAEWLQASSAHFVVYANDSEKDIRHYSERLERYHAAMTAATSVVREVPSPSNRVTVYVVSNVGQVRKLRGDKSDKVSGFYLPRAGGSLAIIPPVSAARSDTDFSMIVLLHEYAHHFLISGGGSLMPRWMSEGGAEFFASASFGNDGSVMLGRPAAHRAGELLYAREVTVGDLLDPAAYEKKKRTGGYDAFYGKSWLLYHYLTFSKERAGQLQRYLLLLVQGKSSPEAGKEAFGDFNALERELDAYMQRPRLNVLSFSADKLKIGPVSVRKLSAGEAAMMPIRIRSRRGVDREQALELLPEARVVAARFGSDPYVLSALAEAEVDAGNDKEAIAAADAALAIDRNQTNAYYQKGLALLRIAEKAENRTAAFNAAREPFLALNALENDHPIPLIYFYQSFIRQGVKPTSSAYRGLQRAAVLAPFDLGLSMTAAEAALKQGQPDVARSNLLPVAVSAHGGRIAAVAQAALARLNSDPKWDGSDMRKLVKAEADDGGVGEPKD